MKKMLMAFDGNSFSEGAFEFVKTVHEHEPVLVTGTFFSSVNYQQLVATAFAPDAGAIEDFNEETEAGISECVNIFKDKCRLNNIEYRIHREFKNWTMQELIKETRFADLLVIGEEVFCTNKAPGAPNAYLKDVLRHSECPVVLVPEHYKKIDKVLIAYDGRKESVFALKHFVYLFPVFADIETEIIYLKEEASDTIPDIDYLEEYSARHFSDLSFGKLHFEAKKYFTTWAGSQENVLVVCGSYGRSGISTMLRDSFIDGLIHNHCMPVFIAHYI